MTLQELNDPEWRLNSGFYKIKDKNKKIIPFKFNAQQKQLYDNQDQKDIVLKSRQIGVSTYYTLKLLDECIFYNNVVSAVLSHKRESLIYLFEIIKFAYDNLPDFIKPEAKYDTKYELSFDNGSKIFVSLEIRSTTCNNLHISEAAFISDESRIKASLETVPIQGGRVSIESTPNGMAGYFYESWRNKTINQHFFPWFDFDEYRLPVGKNEKIKPSKEEKKLKLDAEQIKFRRSKINDLGDLFFQEYPEDSLSCFLTSERSFFNLVRINTLHKDIVKSGQTPQDLQVFQEFSKDNIYVAGADVAEGLGGDYSVCVILDVTQRTVAARIRGYWRPDIFAHEINTLCQKYRFPLLGVERNGMGQTTILELEHLHYPYLFKTSKEKLGWETTRNSKILMLNFLKQCVEDEEYYFPDEFFIKEALTFTDKGGKLEASGNNHDDVIMAYAIALQMAVQQTNQLDFSQLQNLIKIGGKLETATKAQGS